MDKDSFGGTNKRIVGEAQVVLDDEKRPRYADTGSPVFIVAYYGDENKRHIDRLCLLNLGLSRALVSRFSLGNERGSVSTDLYEFIEPGEETEWLSIQLLEAWVASLPYRERSDLEDLLPDMDGQKDFIAAAQVIANGLRSAQWNVRLSIAFDNSAISFQLINAQAYAGLN